MTINVKNWLNGLSHQDMHGLSKITQEPRIDGRTLWGLSAGTVPGGQIYLLKLREKGK